MVHVHYLLKLLDLSIFIQCAKLGITEKQRSITESPLNANISFLTGDQTWKIYRNNKEQTIYMIWGPDSQTSSTSRPHLQKRARPEQQSAIQDMSTKSLTQPPFFPATIIGEEQRNANHPTKPHLNPNHTNVVPQHKRTKPKKNIWWFLIATPRSANPKSFRHILWTKKPTDVPRTLASP